MTSNSAITRSTIPRDLVSGLVTFLVALPLCLGVALASGAPLFSGMVAGIVGGILVGSLSGSHSSVSGPAAGLTAVVAAQIASLGTFESFLTALVLAGAIQVALGAARAGSLADFIPSSVIKGLLAAIGIILILKQIPHLVGFDSDPEGAMAFQREGSGNTFTDLMESMAAIHPGATAIGFLSVILLVVWDRSKRLKATKIPAPLLVVILGVGMSFLFRGWGIGWNIESNHLVQVPVADSVAGFFEFLQWPDFTAWTNPKVFVAAITIAAVASLETLLNLEAVDRLDPQQRRSPPNRELVAQGVGNLTAGLIGGIPVTSVIIRSSVNLNAGAQTKLSTVVHGTLLLVSAMFIPAMLNEIPLSCLAAILLVTGVKLASPKLVKQMWDGGKEQFLPFIVTVVAIVLTDLLIGVLIGLAVAIGFILRSSIRRPLRTRVENHLGSEVTYIELADQMTFLNRVSLTAALEQIPEGGQVLLDAENTDYIDPDLLDVIHDYKNSTAPARNIQVSLVGFQDEHELANRTTYLDHSTRELQAALTPNDVLEVLRKGHERFRSGRRLTRDLAHQVNATAKAQHPLAVVVSCIDSRAPTELIFDQGVGDIFSVRVAGNVVSSEILGSVEYGCAVAGAKLIVVMGHTRCGAVGAAVDLMASEKTAAEATGCQHIDTIIDQILLSVHREARDGGTLDKEALIDASARRNVIRTVDNLIRRSETLRNLIQEGRIAVIGAMYDVVSGSIEFLPHGDAASSEDSRGLGAPAS